MQNNFFYFLEPLVFLSFFFVKIKRDILYFCRLNINYSKIFISHSKSILKFFRTSFLASSPKAIKSFEEAFLLLIKKLQCFCDIWASPIDFPLKPTASINSQAFLLGGFGGHKFYAGKTGSGILYLIFSFTFIPLFIAWLECLIGLTRKADAQGKFVV